VSEEGKKVVLCIDDNDAVLECLKPYLRSRGYAVLTASSGGRGLELFAVHPVDVVIVDGHMPGMDGHRVALQIRRIGPHTPIIMFSGQEDVPGDTWKLVDAFVSKGRTDSLPSLARVVDGLTLRLTPELPDTIATL